MTDLETRLEELTIDAFHLALRRGELTAVELVDWYLARIQAHNKRGAEIQAVVTVNPRVRDEAAAADDFLASTGEFLGALHGVPVLVKDQAETAGLLTTFGSVIQDYVPESDATVITKLKEAGACVLAKTTHVTSGWAVLVLVPDRTHQESLRPCRESGGSSAGTAAGIAANFGLIGIGEDTGGSIRIPASFNNLFGLRVTTGLISRSGFSPLVHFQDTPGPIGRTVSDVARVLDCIVGYDDKDPFTVTSTGIQAGGYARALTFDVPVANWRIGVLESGFGDDGDADVDPVNRVVRAAIAKMEALGVSTIPALEIEDLSRWITDTSVYLKQTKSDITGFLENRPGAPVSSFKEIYESRKFHHLNDLFDLVATGPDSVEGDAEYLQLRLNQQHFQRCVLNIFAAHEVDFLVYPTVRVIPPTRMELEARKYSVLTFPTNTVIGSQAGLPSLTVPVGFTEDGLPIGMELLGTPLSEARMLQFAYSCERAFQARRTPALHPGP